MPRVFALPLGYPVGYVGDGGRYTMALGADHVDLDEPELTCWSTLPALDRVVSDGEAAAVRALASRQAAASAEDSARLFDALSSARPVRQGVALRSDGEPVLVLGRERFHPTPLQLDIWRRSDGQSRLALIARAIGGDRALQGPWKREFIGQLGGLIDACCLFLV